MTATIQPTTPHATAALDDRVVSTTAGALELLSIHLGRRLALYQHLTVPRTAPELARVASIDTRYAREWLEQQAVAGFVTTDPTVTAWEQRRYWLDDHQVALLVTADHPSHVSPLADALAGIAAVVEDVVTAYRTGGGVPFDRYGRALREGQAGVNRPAFTNDLASSWLRAVPDVTARLEAEGGRVLDLGCGSGWSTVALAEAFPRADVLGVDTDVESIADARANAAATASRASFELADAASLAGPSGVDLVVVLEALHDMARPVRALRGVRRLLADGGALLVADERVQPTFVAPGDELERLMYGFSVTHCLPAAMAETPSAAIGTVLRAPMVEALAHEAGFASVEVSDIDAGFFTLYVLRP